MSWNVQLLSQLGQGLTMKYHKLVLDNIFSFTHSDWFNKRYNIPFDQSAGISHGVKSFLFILYTIMELSEFRRFHRLTSSDASILRMRYVTRSICGSIRQRLASLDEIARTLNVPLEMNRFTLIQPIDIDWAWQATIKKSFDFHGSWKLLSLIVTIWLCLFLALKHMTQFLYLASIHLIC